MQALVLALPVVQAPAAVPAVQQHLRLLLRLYLCLCLSLRLCLLLHPLLPRRPCRKVAQPLLHLCLRRKLAQPLLTLRL